MTAAASAILPPVQPPSEPSTLTVIGVDLSGPANVADTSLVVARSAGQTLAVDALVRGADDAAIFAAVAAARARGHVIVGVDAPLSFQQGLRARDSALRQVLKDMSPGLERTIMPPTAPRMVYLTLRGVGLARLLERHAGPGVHLVEVHPGSAMALRGAPPAALRSKRTLESRAQLRRWLMGQPLTGLERVVLDRDHDIDALAAALAAWDWALGRPRWLAPPEPPHHPFAFAC